MIQLNLKAENDCQQAIKDYLENNVSVALAEKINNGVKIEKDGKQLINKKSLSEFWNYASRKAQEMKTGYVANDVVFGWAIHYFEESDIIGTLFNEDGSEYKPPKPEYKPTQHVPAPTIQAKSTPPKPAQASLFDFLTNTEIPSKEEVEPVKNKTDEPAELDVDLETGEILSTAPTIIESKPNSLYQRYLDIEKQYPHAVVAYRLGDFYEIFGDKAIVSANELSLTLTSRDCGLTERIPMIGFPYHACDIYFNKIRQRRKVVTIDDGEIQVLDKLSYEQEQSKYPPVETQKQELKVEPHNTDDDLEDLRDKNKHINKDALCVLLELFDYELDVQ